MPTTPLEWEGCEADYKQASDQRASLERASCGNQIWGL